MLLLRDTSVVNVFDSAYGTLDIILDRYATTSELLALQEDQFKVAFLRPVMTTELPNNGGGKKAKLECEYSLQPFGRGHVDPFYDDPVRNKVLHPEGGVAQSYRL